MNATTTSRTPACTCTGIFAKRSMICGPSVGALAIRQSLIGRPADRLAEHDLAVDHDHQRALVLQGAGVEADRKIVDVDAVLAVGREIVLEPHAAARAQRQRLVGVLIGR